MSCYAIELFFFRIPDSRHSRALGLSVLFYITAEILGKGTVLALSPQLLNVHAFDKQHSHLVSMCQFLGTYYPAENLVPISRPQGFPLLCAACKWL